MAVTDTSDFDTVRERHGAGLFGIDLGFREERLEVDPIVVSEPPRTSRSPRSLTDRLAEAAADRVRWGRSA
jgi:hypothetical protein